MDAMVLTDQEPPHVIDLVDPPAELANADFTVFYRECYEQVAKALSLTLRDPDLGGEAADEAMARAYARWSTLQGYDNPAGWVYRVGLNWARSLHRRLARRPALSSPEPVTQPPIADAALERALSGLDVRLRSVVVCRFLLDWSVDQTAEALDVKPGTVKSRLHRALKELGRKLEPNK